LSVGRVRVCIVNPFQHGGGAELQISLLAGALRQAGRFDVYYLARHVDPAIQPDGYTVVPIGRQGRVPSFGYTTDLAPLYRALRKIQPQVIYQRVAGGYTGICALYGSWHSTPLIWHVAHNTDVMPQTLDAGRNVVRRRLEKWSVEFAIPRAAKIVTQTHDQERLLLQNYGRRADAVIGNFHPEPAEAPDKSGPPTVLWIANLKDWKQPQVFVRLARALGDLQGVRFVMIGEAPSAQHGRWAADLLRDIAATPNLELLGHRPQSEVNQALARASLFVNTSLHEGFPNTFIQAWLRDVAVVSLDVNPDGVLDTAGVGIHARTEERLIAAVRHLLQDPDARGLYVERGRAYAHATHSLRNADKIVELIDDCAAAARA
jgi:glycosyltransferase involved in cell wall biosynthesis